MQDRYRSDRKPGLENPTRLPSCRAHLGRQWPKLLLLLLLTTIVTGCERQVTEREAELNRRGLELRRSILDEYAGLKANGSEVSGHDLTSITSQYIPGGTLFPDAMAILKAAGFTVMPPSSHRYGKEEIFLVAAHISLDSSFFTSGTYAYVFLHVDKIVPAPTVVVEAEGHVVKNFL